jgi:hypothetical protein
MIGIWLVPVICKKYQSGLVSFENKDKKWSDILQNSLFIGMISAFVGFVFCDVGRLWNEGARVVESKDAMTGEIVETVFSATSGLIPVFVMICSALCMCLCGLLINKLKWKWVNDYALPICMIIGMIIGLTGLKMPDWTMNLINTCGNCMSPVAMLLTGMTIAKIDLKRVLTDVSIYAVTIIRLALIPLVAIGVFYLLPVSNTIFICAVCSVAMPLGLTTVVIPAAYGKDTTTASGMALISHFLSCIGIPLIFLLMDFVLKM